MTKQQRRQRPQPVGFRGAPRWLVLLLLTGCSRTMLLFPDPPPVDPFATPAYGRAQICILRPHTWQMLHTVLYEDNGYLVGATRGPSYFCYVAHPGPHRVVMRDNGSPMGVEFPIAAGQRLFLHHYVGLRKNQLDLLSEKHAGEVLDKCEYSQLLDAPSQEVAYESPAQAAP